MITNPKEKPKFLVCVDAHDESIAAMKFACLKAANRGAEVELIHIIAPVDFQTLGIIADRMSEERKKEGEALLQRMEREALTHYGITPTLTLKQGSAGEELLKTIEEKNDFSILIIGTALHTKGRGKLAAWLAQQLGQRLFIPLVMVPGNLTEEQLEALV